jgi:glycosyltransferase involved in cell wall biosynthesis
LSQALKLLRSKSDCKIDYSSEPAEEVPHYIKAFDVCFIPYAINEETDNLSPLKLYDFMATGRPIVTSNFSAAQEFSEVIYIADSKEHFVHHIETALVEVDNYLFHARRHAASLNTWENRVNQISGLIESQLVENNQ